MKLLNALILASITSSSRVSASKAYVYTSEPARASFPTSITPNTARLLFASRLGLSQFHSLDDADELALKTLNDYGGEQRLFSSEAQRPSQQNNLIIIEGVQNSEGKSRQLWTFAYPALTTTVVFNSSEIIRPTFEIHAPPSPSQNLHLIQVLASQDISRLSSIKDRYCSRTLKGKAIDGGISGDRDVSELVQDKRQMFNGDCQAFRLCPYDQGQTTADSPSDLSWEAVLEQMATLTPSVSAIIHISAIPVSLNPQPHKSPSNARKGYCPKGRQRKP